MALTKLLFDIETNGLDFSDGNFIDRVHTCLCLVILDIDTGSTRKYYDTDGLRELGTGTIVQGVQELQRLGPDDELVGHNIIQFDIPVLTKLYGYQPECRIHDTLVTSRTLYPDRPGGHSLEAWGNRLGTSKGDHSDFSGFSLELLQYCEQDVRVNQRIYECLEHERKQGDWQKALDLEHKIADIIARQERKGFYFNKELAEQYLIGWEKEIDEIDSAVLSSTNKSIVLGPCLERPFKIDGTLAKRTISAADKFGIECGSISGPFQCFEYKYPDLNSKAKQKEILLELGWKPEEYTFKTGSPKLDDSILQVGPVGEKLHRRNQLTHRRGQVAGLVEITDQQSRIHGGANPCGTNTSRMRHSRIVNIPRLTSPMGAELRGLFTVPEGKRLVGYDAASLELRILAHYIGNQEYNERICSTKKSADAHTLAAEAAGSDDRDLGKTINYALIYGAGDSKLGSIVGGSTRQGERLRAKLYERIPGLGRLVEQAKSAARKGFIYSIDGRKLYLRRRVSPLNTLIQGGGSIFMKTVAVHLDELVRDAGLGAFKVVDMHDEAQWECPPEEVDALSSLIEQSFDRACSDLSLRCPQEPEIKVGTTWAETH